MPHDRETIIAQIVKAFGENLYPGDNLLQGSVEGYEPAEEVGPFQGKTVWQAIAPEFLDAHAAR